MNSIILITEKAVIHTLAGATSADGVWAEILTPAALPGKLHNYIVYGKQQIELKRVTHM